MDITKIGLIGLTLASFVLVPAMPALDADSSELASWHSEVYENLDGIHQDYDFQKYSPDLNEMVNNIVQTYNGALSGVISFYEGVSNFFQNPGVIIFGEEEFSEDALELGFIPDGRFAQIVWASTFLSNQQFGLNHKLPRTESEKELESRISRAAVAKSFDNKWAIGSENATIEAAAQNREAWV
jgi:hypothetical protein